jgi:hypothetical protein
MAAFSTGRTMLHFHPKRRPRAPLDARTPSPGYIGAMANPFGIALRRVWTEWAAKQGVSETIAAAVSSPRTGGPKRLWVSLIRAS